MKCQIPFSGRSKEKYFKFCLPNIFPSMLNIILIYNSFVFVLFVLFLYSDTQ